MKPRTIAEIEAQVWAELVVGSLRPDRRLPDTQHAQAALLLVRDAVVCDSQRRSEPGR